MNFPLGIVLVSLLLTLNIFHTFVQVQQIFGSHELNDQTIFDFVHLKTTK